jgi:hypothetical protein
MPAISQRLSQSSTCIVLAYAPAGLGHLRVTKALLEGLPKEANATLLPDMANSIKSIHRLTSIHPVANALFEWSQHGVQEDIVTTIYRFFLRQDTHVIKRRLLNLLKEQLEPPKTLLIVCTHFGIAHQVSAIKKQLEKEGNVNVILVVQVTDDSPQKMWYIPHADLITTPSSYTTETLTAYGKTINLPRSTLVTIPYPVSPRLTRFASIEEQENRSRQCSPHTHVLIHVSLPISGAGVGLTFASQFMEETHRLEPRTRFHITAKRTLFTAPFLNRWDRRDYVTVQQSHSDRQIVELYQQTFEQTPIAFEITKPSEQTFKTLLTPKQKGGAIMLFTKPVGRQEYDNLEFLRRHKLIPSAEEESKLCDVLNMNISSPFELPFSTWRGFCLPDNPNVAAKWFSRSLSLRFFMAMNTATPQTSPEVQSTGVQSFWKQVTNIL